MSNKHGFRRTKFPMLTKKCVCGTKFNTQDPTKMFCKPGCRTKHWLKFNKEKHAVITKRYREKKKIEGSVQD